MLVIRKSMTFLTALVLVLSIFACTPKRKTSPGSIALPFRTQLPDYHILDLEEEYKGSLSVSQYGDLPFPTSFIDVNVSATEKKSFVHVAIPDSLGDVNAAQMIDTYWAFSRSLVTVWSTTNTGIIIDLSTNGEGKKTADYSVNSGGNSFPLIIVWDDVASERVKRYFNWLNIVPGVAEASSPILEADYFLQLNNIDTLINPKGFIAPYFSLPQTGGCFR